MHQSGWILMEPKAAQGILTAFWHPALRVMTMVFRQWGSSEIFKLKQNFTSWVGSRRDSDRNGANEGEDFVRRNFQMSESPWSACGMNPGDSHWLLHNSHISIDNVRNMSENIPWVVVVRALSEFPGLHPHYLWTHVKLLTTVNHLIPFLFLLYIMYHKKESKAILA